MQAPDTHSEPSKDPTQLLPPNLRRSHHLSGCSSTDWGPRSSDQCGYWSWCRRFEEDPERDWTSLVYWQKNRMLTRILINEQHRQPLCWGGSFSCDGQVLLICSSSLLRYQTPSMELMKTHTVTSGRKKREEEFTSWRSSLCQSRGSHCQQSGQSSTVSLLMLFSDERCHRDSNKSVSVCVCVRHSAASLSSGGEQTGNDSWQQEDGGRVSPSALVHAHLWAAGQRRWAEEEELKRSIIYKCTERDRSVCVQQNATGLKNKLQEDEHMKKNMLSRDHPESSIITASLWVHWGWKVSVQFKFIFSVQRRRKDEI